MEDNSETMRLLVMSREVAALRSLWSLVESNCWHLETVASGWDAMERIQSGISPHLLIIDVPRKDGDSLYVVRWVRRFRPELPILVLFHSEDADKKNDAIRMGADEVLVRPLSDEALQRAVRAYLQPADRSEWTAIEQSELPDSDTSFVAISPIMRKLRVQAELLAQADVPVLILGEKGSGKQTVARLIHRLSVRSEFKFQKVHCSALPPTFMEEFSGRGTNDLNPSELEISPKGVVLLEEITDMPTPLQLRLLNALERWHDLSENQKMPGRQVRVLVSSSANLERALAERKLREDLYYRLSSFTIHVPPLRLRKEDISPLLRHFMHRLSTRYGLPAREFSQTIIERCVSYSWPGNLTELDAFVKRYLVAGDNEARLGEFRSESVSHASVDSDDSVDGVDETSLKSLVRSLKCETERNAIAAALEKTGWNRKAAARLLQVSYRTLLYKIEQYQMNETESFVSSLPNSQHALTGTGSKDKAS